MDWLDRLKTMKSDAKMTTKEIAAASGVPEPTLEKLFAGQTKDPKLNTVRAVVHCLGHSLDDLAPLKSLGNLTNVIRKPTKAEIQFGLFGDADFDDDAYEEILRTAETIKRLKAGRKEAEK